jgi:hypothetical protein
MKTLFTLAMCASLTVAMAQSRTTPSPAPATTSPAPAQTSPTLSVNQKAFVKEWKFDHSESFDLVQKPTEQQKNDLVNLMDNGRYRLILDGQSEGGTWTIDAGCKWITLTKDDGTVKKFQVLSKSDKEMKVDYRDSDGTHNVLVYSFGTTATNNTVPGGR